MVSTCTFGTYWGHRELEVALFSRFVKAKWVGDTSTSRLKKISKQTDNTWKITSFSESAVCEGLALGGKGDSTSSHLPEGKRDLLSDRRSQLMAQVHIIGIQSPWELEKGVFSHEQSEGPKCWLVQMEDCSALRGWVGKGLKKAGRRGWDASTYTKEKCGLLHICIDSINLGYSEPLCQAFSVGHINSKGWKFIERPQKNLLFFMYKADMHTVYVYSYTYICGMKISWGRAIRKKCLKRYLGGQ